MVKWLLRDGHLKFDGQVVGFFFSLTAQIMWLRMRLRLSQPGQFFSRRSIFCARRRHRSATERRRPKERDERGRGVVCEATAVRRIKPPPPKACPERFDLAVDDAVRRVTEKMRAETRNRCDFVGCRAPPLLGVAFIARLTATSPVVTRF